MKPRRWRTAVIAALLAAMVLPYVAVAADITVYVTKTGKKYHTATCSSLRYSAIPMALSAAAARYGPCSLCRPPIPGAASGQSTSPRLVRPESPTTQQTQCQAITKKGSQCSRSAQSGGIYCWQHNR